MKKSKLAVARGAMHDARHAENTLRENYFEAKRRANLYRRNVTALLAKAEEHVFERSNLIRQRDELLGLVALALPYIEEAEKDPAYKPGAVAKLTARMRKAVEGGE